MKYTYRYLALVLSIVSSNATAEVQFDGSTGGPTGILSGNVVISEQHGLLTGSGDALLHSFARFNVAQGESVSFSHNSMSIENIIARVTGGQASLIDGALFSDANLWLLNPNGVLIGAAAQIDVTGTFKVNARTGADSALVLSNGTIVSVDSNLNTLVVANPAAFGFVGDVPLDPSQRVLADATLGTLVNPTPVGLGTQFNVTGGTAAGANLFHSFERFSVFDQDAATFSSNAAQPYQNVISRVTGDARSFVTGSVHLEGSGLAGSSFWFLNPAGIFIGSGGVLDVAKSFNLGAADSLVSSTSGELLADDQAPQPALFIDNPIRFQIGASGTGGAVDLVDFDFDQAGRSSINTDDGILLFGSTVTLEQVRLSMVADDGQRGMLRLEAPNGLVDLQGTIISSAAQGTANAGRISLEGAQLAATDSRIQAITVAGNDNSPASRIGLNFTLGIELENSQLVAETHGVGSSGNLILESPTHSMHDSSLIARTYDVGDAGAIVVLANDGQASSSISISGSGELSSDAALGVGGADAAGVFLFTDGTLSIDGDQPGAISISANVGTDGGGSQGITLDGLDVLLSDARLTSNQSSVAGVVDDFSGVLIAASNLLVLQSVDLETNSSGGTPSNGAFLDGRIVLVHDGSISATTSGAASAGPVRIVGTDSVGLFGDTIVTNSSSGTGDAGQIVIASEGALSIAGTNQISIVSASTASANGGSAGSISLTALADIDVRNATVAANAVSGAPGFIAVAAPNIRVDGTSLTVAADVNASLPAMAAVNSIGLLATQDLLVTDSSLVTTTAGNVDAPPMALSGLNVRVVDSSILGSTAGAGDAASIFFSGPISDDGLDLSDQADISVENTTIGSATTASGRFGLVNVASRNTTVRNSTVSVETSSPTPDPQGDLLAIFIGAQDTLRIEGSDFSARTTGAMDAGRTTISARAAFISGSRLSSSSTGSGAAGAVNIAGTVDDITGLQVLNIDADSTIRSDTVVGPAGEVNILAGGDVQISGANTRVSTNTSGPADAGTIRIFAGNLLLDEGATIESRATGSGASNLVSVNVLDQFTARGLNSTTRAQILTDSERSQGGNVRLVAGGFSSLMDAAIIASAGADGSGGNISLGFNELIVQRSVVLAQAEGGNGGQIDITLAPGSILIADSQSAVNADSQAGTAGTVNIDAPDTGINSALAAREERLSPTPALARDACRPAADGPQSTFYVRSEPRGATRPDTYLPIHGVPPSDRPVSTHDGRKSADAGVCQ